LTEAINATVAEKNFAISERCIIFVAENKKGKLHRKYNTPKSERTEKREPAASELKARPPVPPKETKDNT